MKISDGLTLQKSQEALGRIRAEFETDTDRLAIVTPERYDEVYEIMKSHFTPDEPLCRSFGVVWEDHFKQVTLENLKQNVSVCLIAKETDEIMGIRIVGVMRRDDPPWNLATITYEPLRELFTFITHQDDRLDFYNKLGVEEAIHFFTLGVHSKYRRRGLGSRLLKAAVAMSRELEFKAIKGEGTSNFSQRIYEKEGFETLMELPYDSYKTPSGHLISEGTGEHKKTKIFAMKL